MLPTFSFKCFHWKQFHSSSGFQWSTSHPALFLLYLHQGQRSFFLLCWTSFWLGNYCCCPFSLLHDNDILSNKAAFKKVQYGAKCCHTWMHQFLADTVEIAFSCLLIMSSVATALTQLKTSKYNHFWRMTRKKKKQLASKKCFSLGFNRPPSGHPGKNIRRARGGEREGKRSFALLENTDRGWWIWQ